MFDHLSITVTNFDASLAFYTAALAPLGYACSQTTDGGERIVGFGRGKTRRFWISEGATSSQRLHLAFHADDHKSVDEFYGAAVGAGGRDNGAPGIREHYHASYYAAFVIDPDGNNIEVVCHFPGSTADQFADELIPAIGG